MFTLETERLRLMALDLENMRLRLCNPQRMEGNLGLQPTPERAYGDAAYDRAAHEAMRSATERMAQDEGSYLWHTFWQVVLKQEQRVVAEFDFHGPPDAGGAVEFGFMTLPRDRNKGYMTEAAGALIGLALRQEGVSALIAETAQDNAASQRVLAKLGGCVHQATEQGLRWRFALSTRAIPSRVGDHRRRQRNRGSRPCRCASPMSAGLLAEAGTRAVGDRRLFVRDCASSGLPQDVRIGTRTPPECPRLAEARHGW